MDGRMLGVAPRLRRSVSIGARAADGILSYVHGGGYALRSSLIDI